VVSPFLNKSNGTERTVIEWLTHLPDAFEIHIYSQQVQDVGTLDFKWHRIPKLPGPHLFNFLWWLAANHLWREWDRRFNDLDFDVVYTPGANCVNADVVSVHIVFAEYTRAVRSQMTLAKNSLRLWPRVLHRKLYYKVAMWMERRVYSKPDIPLVLYTQRTARSLKKFYGHNGGFSVLYFGLDHKVFNPENRRAAREEARRELGLVDGRFVLLLIGNDWRNKGVPVLLDMLARLSELPIDLALVSREHPAEVHAMVHGKRLDGRVHLLPARTDVELYYAAADAYVGPSIEDALPLPPAEAMACGLPVIVSASSGVSETINPGVNGLILNDPMDVDGLAGMVRRLWDDKDFRDQLGRRAAESVRQFTWERGGRQLAATFDGVIRRKRGTTSTPMEREA
jgi:glycosyltransferase involved in cell wall biosynthesis